MLASLLELPAWLQLAGKDSTVALDPNSMLVGHGGCHNGCASTRGFQDDGHSCRHLNTNDR